MAREAMVKYWCDAYSCQVKYQFHYSIYGHDGAHELAKEVCRRSGFFFLQWLHQDSDTFLYEQARLDAYEEKLGWLDWISVQDINSVGFIRGLKIKQMFPINPELVDG